jgi:type I restriction enzyme S subunit
MINMLSIKDVKVFDAKGVTPKYVPDSSTIVLNQKCVHDGIIDWSFAQLISDEQTIPENKYVKSGDLLINSTGTGTAGRSAYVGSIPDGKKVVIDSHMLVVRFNDDRLSRFFAYFLYAHEARIKTMLIGSSGQGELDKQSVFDIKFPYHESASSMFDSLLKSINEKIALNGKLNTKLDEMAQLLYGQWFIQFDFLDANNRPYKTTGGAMVYSAELKREIPASWAVKHLAQVTTRVQSGGTPSTKNETFYNGAIKWFSTKELADGFVLDSEKHISDDALAKSSAKLFPAGSVLVAIYASPTAGRLGILSSEGAINQAITAIVPEGEVSAEYIFLSLLVTRPQLLALATGTSQQNLSNQVIKDYFILVPPDSLLKSFNDLAKPIFEQLRSNTTESARLSELRDFLLPILMNGQIKVE